MIKKHIPGFGYNTKACALHSLMQQADFDLGKFYHSLSPRQKECLQKKRVILRMGGTTIANGVLENIDELLPMPPRKVNDIFETLSYFVT